MTPTDCILLRLLAANYRLVESNSGLPKAYNRLVGANNREDKTV